MLGFREITQNIGSSKNRFSADLFFSRNIAVVCWRYVRFQFDPEAVIAIIYLNSLNAGLNDDITHFPHWEYIAVNTDQQNPMYVGITNLRAPVRMIISCLSGWHIQLVGAAFHPAQPTMARNWVVRR